MDGQDAMTYIRNSIVEPNAYVEKGYAPGVMPQDFSSRMSQEQLDTLVSYLASQ